MTRKPLQKSRSAGMSQRVAQASRQFVKTRNQVQFVEDEFAELVARDANRPITDIVKDAPTPSAMLQAARDAGKTEQEINAFAAKQPMTPIAIKGVRVYVRDCFGRVFGLDDVPENELSDLVAKGVPYTPYSNRQQRRADARRGQRAR